MKKYIVLFVILPFIVCAQHDDFNLFPYKSNLLKYLKPQYNTFYLDTNNTGYSTLQYRSFSSNGQYVGVNHQQNITDYILFNINFHKFSQEGIFNREALKLHHVKSNLYFKNKKENYIFNLSLDYSKIRMDENGGINNYNSDDYDDPLLFTVNLSSAQNEAKNRNHKIAQKFIFTDKWSIDHEFSILSNRRTYSDLTPNSGFYNSIFLDSTATFDSLSAINYKSLLSLNHNYFSFKQLFFKRKAFIHSLDSTDNDFGFGLDVRLPHYNIEFNSEFYKSNHYIFSLSKSFVLSLSSHQFNVSLKKIRIPIFTNSFVSNHFLFNNQFTLEQQQSFNYKYRFKNINFSTHLKRLFDHFYLDQNAFFQQFKSPIIHSISTIKYNLKLSKIHLFQELQYQYSDTKDILRFPDINSNTSIWYETDLFNQKLNTKIGVSVNYFSSFYANSYNPALADYQLQDIQSIGETPLASTFLKLQLHNMFIALEYSNITHFMGAKTPYFIPNYPTYPSTIRLSILWKLYNG